MMNNRDRFVMLVQTMCVCERFPPMSPGDALLVLGDAMAYGDDVFAGMNPVDAAAAWWGWRRNNGPKPRWVVEWEENAA